MMKSIKPRRDETLDGLLGGKVSVFQGKGGYRFSLDAVLLAHFVKLRRQDRVFDLGSGNGVKLKRPGFHGQLIKPHV